MSYERLSALFLDGCRPHIANILPAHEPVAIEINGLLHGEFARTGGRRKWKLTACLNLDDSGALESRVARIEGWNA